MEKVIIIASSVILVFVVALTALLSFVTFSPALITYWEQDQISHNLESRFEGYGKFRCYGRENGYIIVFVSKFGKQLKYAYIADIDGIIFANPQHFSLYAYKDGRLIDIEDAYEQGLISREAILKAQEYHLYCQKSGSR